MTTRGTGDHGEPGQLKADEPPLVRGEPIREWAFSELRGDSLRDVEVSADIQVGGLLHELHDFGPTFRDPDVFFPDESSLPPDGIATGRAAARAIPRMASSTRRSASAAR